MSAGEPVIAVSNEISESERVDASAVPPSEHSVVKDVSTIGDSSPAGPVTELPAETAQTASDDTLFILSKHDTNIPNSTPTDLNGPVDGVEVTPFVNEPDNTIIPVEIRKVDDADKVAEDKAPIDHGVNGDVEGTTPGGSDLDPADQTLVEDLSQDADTSVTQEIVDVPVKILDADAEKIVVEEDEGDKVTEPVAEDVVPDVAPVPEVKESISAPVEETPAPAEPGPKVESRFESLDAEPPIVKPVEVDATDPGEVELAVDLGKDEPTASEEPAVEEIEVVSVPVPPLDEPVVDSVESKPAEAANDISPVTEDAPEEPVPTSTKLVVVDLDAAEEVEQDAAELEVAPEHIDTVLVIKDDPEHIPEEPANIKDPVAEPEVAPTVGTKDEEITPTTESAPESGIQEPMIEDLNEARKVEGHATEIEIAPVVAGSHVEEEPADHPAVEIAEVPPVIKEDTPLPAANGHGHEELVESIEEIPAVGVAEVPPKVGDVSSKAETVEPEPARDAEVAGLEDLEEVDVTPIPTLPASEHAVEPVEKEGAPAIDSVESVTPNVVTEEKFTGDEPGVSPPEAQEEPTPDVASSAEEPEPPLEVTEQEVPAPVVSKPIVEPAAEDEPASGVLEPEVPASELALGEVPPVNSEPVTEPQAEAIDPPAPVPSEEKVSIDEAKPEEASPAVSEPAEAIQGVPTPNIPQETKQVEGCWTPSYSVSSQGGLDSALPADEEVVDPTPAPEPLVEEPAADSAPTPEIVIPEGPVVAKPESVADNVQKSPPWTPSYSTTAQGSSPRLESQAILENEPESVLAESEDISSAIQDAEPEPTGTEPAVEELTPQIVSSAEELTTVEPDTVFEEVSKSPSWTPSYSTAVQGSSPRLGSEAALEDDSELFSEQSASDDVQATTQDAESVPTPAETVAVVEVLEPTATEDAKPADEVPAINTSPEEPSDVSDPSLDQARLTQPEEAETERPKSPWTPSYAVTTLSGSGSSPRVDSKPELDETPTVEAEIEAAETPKIITPEDGEPAEPSTTTETPWTQPYSVTSQPSSPRVSPKVELEELEPEPQPVESVHETHVAAPIIELSDVPKTVVTPVVDQDISEPVLEEELKPAWTRSYSVTSQPGSPRISPKQVPQEISEAEEVKPSWTQSYSVTSQPGSPRVLPKEDLPEPTVEPVIFADEPTTDVSPPIEEAVPQSTESAPSKDTEPQPEVEAPVTDTALSEPLTVKDERSEQPKSPWTPSYSVTTLPGSVPAEEPGPDSVADESSVDAEAPAPEPIEVVKAAEDHSKENGTMSDVFEVHEAVTQLVHDEPQVDVKIPEPAPQLDLPKPDAAAEAEEKSPWTPSYSVTHLPGASPEVETKEELPASQDIPAVDESATKEVESTLSYSTYTQGSTTNATTRETTKDDGAHYFPGVPESLDETPEKPKLDLLTSVDPPNISKISPRGRYESSTSSRLFPGAWFSSPKSPGDESRTSMEEATGEFILSRSSVAPNEPAVAEAPEDVPASPITPATPTTKKDKKWRMCEIM